MEYYLKRQLYIAACVYIGQILLGYGLGWTAPVIPKLQDPEQTPLPSVITESQSSWIGSVLFIGAIVGPNTTGYLSNIIGRKPCLFIGGSIVFLAYLLLALANNFAMIIVGRIINGVGNATIFVVNLVYIAEISSTNLRGILLTGTGLFSAFGTLICYSIGPYVQYSVTSFIGMGISLLYLAGLFGIPESPVFQVLKGQNEQAKATLLSLGRENDIDKVLQAKQDNPNIIRKQEWIEIITVKANRKAMFITLTLNVLQQMSGSGAVVFFATSIFEWAGSSIDPNIATIIIGVTQTCASVITPFFIEISGRKPLLLFSTALCSISLSVLGAYFYFDDVNPDVLANIKWLPLVTLIVFFISFGLGYAIIPVTLIGEMFKSNVRSTGSTVVVSLSWLVGFGVSTAFGYMIDNIGASITFWIYAGSCALAFLFTVIFIPETKGKSLLEIEEMLSK